MREHARRAEQNNMPELAQSLREQADKKLELALGATKVMPCQSMNPEKKWI